MTSQEMIAAAVTDPMVIAAHSVAKPDGTVTPPNAGDLGNRAKTYLSVTLGMMLLNQAIGRRLQERSATLTLTAGTSEYTLPVTVSRVINMRRGSDNRPIRFFESKDEHDQWYFETHADDTITDTDEIERAYYSGRGTGNAIKITFSPGVGSETSIPYRYVRRMSLPYDVSDFPEEIHPAIFIGLLNRMAGGQIEADAVKALEMAERFLQPVASATAEMRYDEDTQQCVDSINSLYG